MFCIWLLLQKKGEPIKIGSPEVQSQITNQQMVNQAKASKIVDSRSVVVPSVPNTPYVPPRPSLLEVSNLQQRELETWQKPIEFYGKVIDENSNSVAGVNIHFRWSEEPSENGMRTSDTQSDSDGLFSLTGKQGRSLTVWFNKDGYYSSHNGQMGFNYALGPDIIAPNPFNPVIFRLQKKGTPETLIAVKRNYGIPRDGTPVSIDLSTGATATAASGNFVVRCWTQDAGKQSGEKYDWRCTVSFPGGGAATNSAEFAYQAPVSGYTPSLEISMPVDRPD